MKATKSFLIILYLVLDAFLCTSDIQAFRFVVYSDCRAPKADASKPFPANLYNEPVLTFINAQVTALSPKPKFVIVLGDLVNFAYPNAGNDSTVTNNLTYWKRFMKQGLDSIPLLVCVGNSDLYSTATWWTEEARQKEFAQVFSDMPDNGPTTPVDFRHLVYSFETGTEKEKSLFVVLDSFGIYGTGETATHCDNDFDPYPYPAEQMNWFSDKAKSSKALHKFVFSHGPAFSVEGFSVNRNVKKIWDIAVANKFDTFFCAHEHLYYRWRIDKKAYPPAAGKLTQLLSGTAGAVPDSPSNVAANPSGRIFFGYTFVVVDVNAANVVIQTYGVTQNGNSYISKLIDTETIIEN